MSVDWKEVHSPERKVIEGMYVRLEPLCVGKHAEDLFESLTAPDADARFRYLPDPVPSDIEDFRCWVARAEASNDPLFFVVIDKRTGRAEGREALMRIDSTHGVIEIGNILWGPAIARTHMATESVFLLADCAFSGGFRRLEWKCDNLNLPSKRAAERFGFTFEGLFRQHMIVKGRNRDTAWFSILDSEWAHFRQEYLRWLAAENFDEHGKQKTKLKIRDGNSKFS